jgi:hypothetical protein
MGVIQFEDTKDDYRQFMDLSSRNNDPLYICINALSKFLHSLLTLLRHPGGYKRAVSVIGSHVHVLQHTSMEGAVRLSRNLACACPS